MKKKLFVGVSAAALAAVMCVAFVGCGSSGGGKAKGIKGEQVTEEQWDAALDALEQDDAVFTIDYLEENESKMSGGGMSGSQKRTCTINTIKNGAKEYTKMVDRREASGVMADPSNPGGEEIDEMYAERVGSTYTIYEKNEAGEWETTEHGDSIVPISVIFSVVSSVDYEKYEYSTEHKGYILKTTAEGENPYVLKFDKEGRLAAIYRGYQQSGSASGVKASASYTLSVVITYTAAEVNLPTVA